MIEPSIKWSETLRRRTLLNIKQLNTYQEVIHRVINIDMNIFVNNYLQKHTQTLGYFHEIQYFCRKHYTLIAIKCVIIVET